MDRVERVLWAVLTVSIAATASGCGAASGDMNEPPVREPVAQEAPAFEQPGQPQPGMWECAYSPTYDEDWHNDILCSDGMTEDRPYLLPSDSYITETEIRDAAAEYEDQLNFGGADTAPQDLTAGDTGGVVPAAETYPSVVALRDAVIAAGYPCPAWEQSNRVVAALESGTCSDYDVFSIYGSAEEVQGAVDVLQSVATESVPVSVLTGPNWIVNVDQPVLGQLANRIGGTVVEFAG